MDWIRRERYYFESDNGKYRISIAYVREQCIYTAWRCKTRHGEPCGRRFSTPGAYLKPS